MGDASYACRSLDHLIARRRFMGGVAASLGAAAGLSYLTRPAAAQTLASDQKRVLMIFLSGGLSQFESWDPKPATRYGGPFAAIPTSVPGVHVSELLPNTARQMHRMLLVRGMSTPEKEHEQGTVVVRTGHDLSPGNEFPQLGAVVAKALHREGQSLPGNLTASTSAGGRSRDAAYLGPEFSAISVGGAEGLVNSSLPTGVTVDADGRRQAWRRAINDRFLANRRSAETDAYVQSYEQALELMRQRQVFDIAREPERDQARYGKTALGRSLLLARRLIEHGVPFVEVGHGNYDTHANNFNFHIDHLDEFDACFPLIIADLAERGLLQHTLVLVLSEFGRSPEISPYFGREHWSQSWSLLMAGCGVPAGGVYGATNALGTEVVEGRVDHRQMFHTVLSAVGIDSSGEFVVEGRSYPVADPSAGPVKELLA
jgi:uncharacterized protein (DUF1501 family)